MKDEKKNQTMEQLLKEIYSLKFRVLGTDRYSLSGGKDMTVECALSKEQYDALDGSEKHRRTYFNVLQARQRKGKPLDIHHCSYKYLRDPIIYDNTSEPSILAGETEQGRYVFRISGTFAKDNGGYDDDDESSEESESSEE